MTARDALHRLGLFLILSLALSGARVSAQAPRVNVAIPEGPAQRTFQIFFSQTRIEILYLADAVKDVRTHAVAGNFDADDAVRKMVEGTGLEFQFFQNYSFVSLRPRTEFRQAAGAGGGESGPSPLPPKDQKESPYAPIVPLVTVTGTYIPGVYDISSPLVTTTGREARSSSYATVQDALQKLPIASKSGPGEDFSGNGNFNRGTSINLRGLGTGATLILVNGRRQTASGMLADFVDVSALPITAVDRIEVLPDGASALYGSDAIAGVVNIILRTDVDGLESFVRQGSAHGGGSETLVSQLFGTHWSHGKAWAGYQYLHRTDLNATARRYSASSDKQPLGGSDFRSFLSNPGNIYDPRTLMPAYGLPDKNGPITIADLSKSVNLSDRMHYVNLLPDRRQHNVIVNGEHQFNSWFSISGEGRITRRDIRARHIPTERPLAVPATNPFAVNPFGTPVIFLGYSFEGDFGPIESAGRTDSIELFLSSRFMLGTKWDVKVNGWIGNERLDYEAYNQPDLAALTDALNSQERDKAFDPFGHMTLPDTLEKIRGIQHETARSGISVVQTLLGGPLFAMWGGDAKVAVGVEHRSELFESGVQTRRRFHRESDALFTEFAFPLWGDPINERGTPRLDLSVTGRYERYSDFGSTANPKIGLRWSPSDDFKLRGSWGKSFKAPRITDIYDTSQNRSGFASLPDPSSPTGRSIVLAVQGSNPNLQEEKAKTWTLGFDAVFHKLLNARLSGTYFATAYRERITTPAASAPFDILRQGDRWQAVITRAPAQAEIDAICDLPGRTIPVDACKTAKVAAIVDYRIRNLSSTEARGLDLRLSFDTRTSLGLFNFDLQSSYYLKLDQSVSPTSTFTSELGTIGNPPRIRGRATLQWWQRSLDLPGFNANISTDYSDAYRDLDAGRSVSPLTTLDMQLGFRTGTESDLLSDLDVALNVVNVFNHQPPFVNSEYGYDALNSDPYGRVWSIMVGKRW